MGSMRTTFLKWSIVAALVGCGAPPAARPDPGTPASAEPRNPAPREALLVLSKSRFIVD
jgi:hypothetical protein